MIHISPSPYFLLHLREIIFLIHACVLFNLVYQQYCYLMQERLISYRACFSSGNVCIIGHVILLGFQMQHFSSVIPDLFLFLVMTISLQYLLGLFTSILLRRTSTLASSAVHVNCDRNRLGIHSLHKMWCGTIAVISYGTAHAAKVIIIPVLDFWWIMIVTDVLHEYGLCSCACVHL